MQFRTSQKGFEPFECKFESLERASNNLNANSNYQYSLQLPMYMYASIFRSLHLHIILHQSIYASVYPSIIICLHSSDHFLPLSTMSPWSLFQLWLWVQLHTHWPLPHRSHLSKPHPFSWLLHEPIRCQRWVWIHQSKHSKYNDIITEWPLSTISVLHHSWSDHSVRTTHHLLF